MKLIIANWKMRVNLKSAIKLAESVCHFVEDSCPSVKVVLAPAFTEIEEVGKILGRSGVELGAQDMFWQQKGAFTGEISPEMLKEAGAKYVILGHSERRALGETDSDVNKKVRAAVKDGLAPIICVGESLAERRAGKKETIVSRQLKAALSGSGAVSDIVVAYEPVWAIGTGVPENPNEAVKMHEFIRQALVKNYGRRAAEKIKIIYGGSVSAKNAAGFLEKDEINGALVGGASVKIGEFKNILKIAGKYK
ncbi:MAG: triose-phosphate isomerase [Patescibacteria group bacterium]